MLEACRFTSNLLYALYECFSPGDDLIDLLNTPVCVRPSVRTPTNSFFSDFDLIWCVGRPRPDMRTNVTSMRSKVKFKVTALLKFRKIALF